MKQILFFALRDDLLPVLDAVERDGPLKYVRTGQFVSPNPQSFMRSAEIPDLGQANANSSIACESFLVTESALPVNVRRITTTAGVERYCIDQLVNPDTIAFTPAGLWISDIVLSGRVATVSASAISQSLMKRFYSPIRTQFSKIKVFWVGRHARDRLDTGKRLTTSVQSPHDFDLTAR
jgi:hypothetical protein